MEKVRRIKGQPRNRRFALALTQADYDSLVRLSQATQKPPAVCVREILLRYIKEHEAEIEASFTAANEFNEAQRRFEEARRKFDEDKEIFNSNQMSLFPELHDDVTEAT